ncbi:MAG: ADP-glyceromanno-heptose 6-epimerase [Patescibacteria group bacterium]
MENKKILITGGAGFIGSNLVKTLQEKYPGNKYYIIDNFSSGNADNLIDFKGEIISDNIVEVDFNKHFDKLDIIFHQAAITDTTVFDEKKMLFNNVDGFKNVLNFALKCRAKLIYASSAAVYGHSTPPMQVGKNEVPANIYGLSKLNADNIARENFNSLHIVGLRYFNVYGPGEKYKGKMASMIWQLYLQMKEGRRPKIFKYGEQKRDQVYIKDIVNANLLALESKKSGIFNVGSGKATTFNEIIKNLNEVLGADFEPEYIDNPYKHYQEYTEADLVETKKALSFIPEYDINKGIEDYFKK